ncbi:MAG: HNH endonuclease [Synechococcaceae cyanobacterium SM2_3_2]|nr:HNH endonuclease [Synechococcaceae cyanobacterium SM2_3_2]
MAPERKSRARQKFLSLAAVSEQEVPGNINREGWLEEVCQNFVCPSDANKSYYRVLLEELWPVGHGIPGPRVKEDELREAINRFRRSQHLGPQPYKPYVDVFRRLRELQGEEGITGIGREGKTYQLVSLSLSEKRVPRIKLSDLDWLRILDTYQHRCPVCNRSEPEVRFQQDHKIPRTRGGGNELSNWQPLCDECNNFKSTSCRGCQLECEICSWAFPERFAPLRLSSDNISRLRQVAASTNSDPHDLLNQIVACFFLNQASETGE